MTGDGWSEVVRSVMKRDPMAWLFFIPFIGLAIGAVMGGLMGKFSDYGIDDKFIKEVQSKVTEGTSALFLVTYVPDIVLWLPKLLGYKAVAPP